MFVEKLTKQELADFVRPFKFAIEEIRHNQRSQCYIKLATGYQSSIGLILSDFDCIMTNNIESAQPLLKQSWRNFLFKKFGKDYQDALRNQLQHEVDSLGTYNI